MRFFIGARGILEFCGNSIDALAEDRAEVCFPLVSINRGGREVQDNVGDMTTAQACLVIVNLWTRHRPGMDEQFWSLAKVIHHKFVRAGSSCSDDPGVTLAKSKGLVYDGQKLHLDVLQEREYSC